MASDVRLSGNSEATQRALGGAADYLSLAEPLFGRPRRQPSLGQLPPALPSLAAGDDHHAADPKEGKHPVDVAASGPATRSPGADRAIFEFAGRQWPPTAQLADHVAAQCRICRYPQSELADPGCRPAVPVEHQASMDLIILGPYNRCGI